MAVNTTRFPLRSMHPRSASARRSAQPGRPSDDEILGLVTSVPRPAQNPPFAGKIAPTPAALAQKGSAPDPRGSVAAGEESPVQQAPQSLSQYSVSAGSESAAAQKSASSDAGLTPEIDQILGAHPQLRAAWHTAQEFQSVFASPAAAQDAKSQLDDLDEMFFSKDPSAQAALAARIHELSPEAFHALTQAMKAHEAQVSEGNSSAAAGASKLPGHDVAEDPVHNSGVGQSQQAALGTIRKSPGTSEPRPYEGLSTARMTADDAANSSGATSPQAESAGAPDLQKTATHASHLAFFHSTNSAAVHQVLGAIESQVTHLLPASVSAPTKTRIVGEIYRELGSALSANRQLGNQLRQAFRSGAGDAAHQRAIVALVAGRARQALPSIARRVINEWTHGVVSANQEKLSRQTASAKRVDISGGASSDGVNRRPVSPRDVDYKRLSDADILDL